MEIYIQVIADIVEDLEKEIVRKTSDIVLSLANTRFGVPFYTDLLRPAPFHTRFHIRE